MKILVIGYGNTLRGDDGVGPRVAEAIESLHLPGVETLVCQQLSPEQSEAISRAEKVIFVDAAINTSEVQMWQLDPADSSQLLAHSADPRTLLALSRDVYGHAPSAWWLTIPAERMEFCEGFSPKTKKGFSVAVERILPILRSNDTVTIAL